MVTESLQKIAVRAVHFPLLALLFNACSTSIATTGVTTILTTPASSQTVKVDSKRKWLLQNRECL
jgi:hypothetical protein